MRPCPGAFSVLLRRRRREVPQGDIIHDILAPLDVVLETIKPPPEGVVSEVQLPERAHTKP